MKKQTGFSMLITLIVVVVLVLLAVIGYYFYSRNASTPVNQTSEQVVPAQQTTETSSLDNDLNSLQVEADSSDLSALDQDLNQL